MRLKKYQIETTAKRNRSSSALQAVAGDGTERAVCFLMPDEPVDRAAHDQAFKQLLAEFTLEALAFFAAPEGERIPPAVRTTLLRQEQISARLGRGHRELDFLVLLEWPDGSEEAIVFLLEE